MLKTRIYKYALNPTDAQRGSLERTGQVSRFLWNRLVRTFRYALNEIRYGRRGNIENEYIALLSGKELVGMRAAGVAKLAAERNISKEEALPIFVREKSEKDITIKTSKKTGRKLKKWCHRHLAWKYAMEKVNSEREKLLSPDILNIWTGIQAKWSDYGESLDKGNFNAPRYKKYGQISAIQKQIFQDKKTKRHTIDFGEYVDLSWCGSDCLEKVAVIFHRPLPSEATIKQLALIKDSCERWFICSFVEAEETVFARDFGSAEGKTVGIDPGMKTALTTSDGEKFTPRGLSKDNRKEKKLKKLQRQLDRQTRVCNPHCFDEKGRWKRGQKITFRSKGMLETAAKMAEIKLHFKDAKADFYHNTAIRLLRQYDTIAIGNAKMHTLARGEGKQKRAFNERSREHAISDFKMKLQDKASLSLTPKMVYDTVEANTTRTCHECGFVNDKLTLNDRSWTCPQCNTYLDRDVNAAINIKISAMKQTAAQAVMGAKAPKVRKPKANASTEGRVTETTSPQGGGLMQESFASVQVTDQPSVSARTLHLVVAECVSNNASSVDPSSPSEMTGCSQSQTCPTVAQQLTS